MTTEQPEPLEPEEPEDDPGPEVGVDDRDRKIVAALAVGMTWEQAATEAGCSKSTVKRRLRRAAVRELLEEERERSAAQVTDVLTRVLPRAVYRLADIVAPGHKPTPGDRDAIAAAKVLLAEGRAWRDHKYVVDQLADAEARLRAREVSS